MFKPLSMLRTRLGRAAAVTVLAAAAAGSAFAADYRYWYHDENGNYNAGDLSNGNAALPAPAWACARRFLDGAQLQWIGEYGAGLGANNGGQDVFTGINVHFGTGPGCKPRPRIETHPGGNVINPRLGTHYLEIDPDAGSYYIDKDGGWPACNCAAPVGFKALLLDVRWGALDNSFEIQLGRNAAGGHKDWILIESMSSPLMDLQRSVAAEIGKRRLSTLPTIEAAVRQLEDIALGSLSAAAGQLEQCRAAQDRAAKADAYRSCDRARRSVMQAQRALKVVLQEMR